MIENKDTNMEHAMIDIDLKDVVCRRREKGDQNKFCKSIRLATCGANLSKLKVSGLNKIHHTSLNE